MTKRRWIPPLRRLPDLDGRSTTSPRPNARLNSPRTLTPKAGRPPPFMRAGGKVSASPSDCFPKQEVDLCPYKSARQ